MPTIIWKYIVEIPESEELIIPKPQGMQNLYDILDDSEIEANTPRAEILKMEIAGTKIESPELPRIEELNWSDLSKHFDIHWINFTNFEN